VKPLAFPFLQVTLVSSPYIVKRNTLAHDRRNFSVYVNRCNYFFFSLFFFDVLLFIIIAFLATKSERDGVFIFVVNLTSVQDCQGVHYVHRIFAYWFVSKLPVNFLLML
jgi:hypothetical protein